MPMGTIAVRAGIVAAVVATATAAAGTAAQATPPGPGVAGTILSQTTVGHTDYILREITIPAGQSTGWHFHDGDLFGLVKQGTLSHFNSDCQPDGVYPTGGFIHEPHGDQHVHIGRNIGKVPVILDVLYVLPHGSPLSEDAPNPGCDFQ